MLKSSFFHVGLNLSRANELSVPPIQIRPADGSTYFRSYFENHDEPLVDTNAIRVVGRVFSYKPKNERPRTDLYLWRFVRRLIPKTKGRDFNLDLLDFGANVCTPTKPRCSECPLVRICDYYHELQTTVKLSST